jgi:hypothetical protein
MILAVCYTEAISNYHQKPNLLQHRGGKLQARMRRRVGLPGGRQPDFCPSLVCKGQKNGREHSILNMCAILGFSNLSSDEAPTNVLTAMVTFTVLGTQLLIDINNTLDYEIAQVQFDSDMDIIGFDFAGELGVDYLDS